MTIISAETKNSPRRSSSASRYVVRDGIVRLTGKPGEIRTPVLKAPNLMHRKPVPTVLVEDFIQSFKELDSYK
jgi:phenylalanine ammonia-lyase